MRGTLPQLGHLFGTVLIATAFLLLLGCLSYIAVYRFILAFTDSHRDPIITNSDHDPQSELEAGVRRCLIRPGGGVGKTIGICIPCIVQPSGLPTNSNYEGLEYGRELQSGGQCGGILPLFNSVNGGRLVGVPLIGRVRRRSTIGIEPEWAARDCH